MKKTLFFATLFFAFAACEKTEKPIAETPDPTPTDTMPAPIDTVPTAMPAQPTDFVIYEFDGQPSDTFWVVQPVDFYFVSVNFSAKSAKTGKKFWLHSTNHALGQHFLAGIDLEGWSFSHNSPPFCQMNETVEKYPAAKGQFYEAIFNGSFADSAAVQHVFAGKFRVERTY